MPIGTALRTIMASAGEWDQFFLDWREIDPEDWDAWQEYMEGIVALNDHNELSVSYIGPVFNQSLGWSGGVLAPNGCIYCPPRFGTAILKIDTNTDTVTTFGTFAAGSKWDGGALAKNGKIYAVPLDAGEVLKIDPDDDSYTTFGGDDIGEGTDLWSGAVMAPNGKIYGIPNGSEEVLLIDPDTDTISMFGTVGSATGKWVGGVLAPNGKIYGMPFNANTVLCIDTSDNSITTFGSVAGSFRHTRGVLALSGMIYSFPSNPSVAIKINPTNNTVGTFGDFGTGDGKNRGVVLAPNGLLYGIPGAANNDSFEDRVIVVDPETDTIVEGTVPTAGTRTYYWGAVLALNGKMYCIPGNFGGDTQVAVIDVGVTPFNFAPLTAYWNNF